MSNQTKAIIISPAGSGFTVSIPGEWTRLKTQALESAKLIQRVTTPDEQTAALQAAGMLKGLSAAVEETRVQLKKPYWDAGKNIDAKAKEAVAEIDSFASQIEKLIGEYQRIEREKADATRREQERQHREAELAAQRERQKLEEIERQRIAAERQAQEASTKKQREAAAAELAKLEQQKLEAEIAQSEAQSDASVVTVAVEAPKASGAAISEVFDYEVKNIREFLKWDDARKEEAYHYGKYAPDFVEITIKRREFKEYLSLVGDTKPIPGIIITKETKAAVRSVAPSLTLQ